jgi:hypothetical protein
MSTCHKAPDDAPDSLEDPRRLEDPDSAEFRRRRPLGPTFLLIPPVLDVARLGFLTRPPSFERRSDAEVGDAGALSAVPCPKYSLPVDDIGVEVVGEPGSVGEFEPAC